MGGYMGSIATVLKNNKTLLGEKIRPTRKNYIGTKEVQTDDFIKATPELLKEIRNKIQKENKRKKKIQIGIAILSLVITILLLYAISTLEWVGIKVII